MVENGGSNAWILDRMEKGKEENLTFSQNQNLQGTAHNTGIVSSSINEAKNNEIVNTISLFKNNFVLFNHCLTFILKAFLQVIL